MASSAIVDHEDVYSSDLEGGLSSSNEDSMNSEVLDPDGGGLKGSSKLFLGP